MIIIHAQAFPDVETYSYWEQLESPKCPMCHWDMIFLGPSYDDVYPESWQCKWCGYQESYRASDYGEVEVECDFEEWEARHALARQRKYLERRYGDAKHSSIYDYWIK